MIDLDLVEVMDGGRSSDSQKLNKSYVSNLIQFHLSYILTIFDAFLFSRCMHA